MKVQEFIEKAKDLSNTNIIKGMLDVQAYLPFAEKRELAARIVEQSVVDEDGYIQIDEIKKYIVFTTETIQAYTNLEFSHNFDMVMVEYDMLCSLNLLNVVLATFETEYKIILELVSMATDYVLKSNSIECQAAKMFKRLGDNIDGITASLQDAISKSDLNNLNIAKEDIEILKKFATQYLK